MATDNIKDFIDLDYIKNSTARMLFLLNRLQKDVRELKELGVTVDIENVPCECNDNLMKGALK